MEGEGIIAILIFGLFIYWIIKPKPEQQQQTTSSNGNSREHIRIITAREEFKAKYNRYPNLNSDEDIIAFIKYYNDTEKEQKREGGYYHPRQYPPQNQYHHPGPGY